jgi:photosystem II stability/assembly factor-like uncharacterized protein
MIRRHYFRAVSLVSFRCLSIILFGVCSFFLPLKPWGYFSDSAIVSAVRPSQRAIADPVADFWIPEPFAPSGHFETSFAHRGNIAVSREGVLFLYGIDGLFRSNDGGRMWQWSAPAPKALALSPSFDQDRTVFTGYDCEYCDAFRISSNGGLSWRNPQQPITVPVTAIGISPSFSVDQTLYVTTNTMSNQRQLLRSTDGGEHWQALTYPPRNSFVTEIVLSPYFIFDRTLYVRMYDYTLWCSHDGGATWGRADNDLGTGSGNYVYDLEVAHLGGGYKALLAATYYALVITFDDGQTWYLIDWVSFTAIAVPLDFATSLTIFGIDGASERVRRTTNLGESWTELLSGHSTRSLAISPNYPCDRSIYARSQEGLESTFWVSHNGGSNWLAASSRPTTASPDLNRAFQVISSPDLDNDGVVFAVPKGSDATDHILKSVDGARSWIVLRLPESGFPEAAISPDFANDQTVFVLMGQHLYKSSDGGEHWTPIGAPQPASPAYNRFLRLSPDYANDQAIFVGVYGQGHGVYRSTDKGQKWTLVTENVAPAVTDFDISPGYPDDPVLFVNTYNNGIFRSDDGGATWVHLSSPNYSPDFIVELSPAFSQDGTLFVAANGISSGGAFRSDDRGDSWVDITGGVLNHYVQVVGVSPCFAQDRTIIMGSESRPLYISEDAGSTWFPLRGISTVGAYGRKYGLTITCEDGFLVPLASTPQAIYRYHWPSLHPSPVAFALEPGATTPMLSELALDPGEEVQIPWSVNEEENWLAVEPITGTLPTSPVLIVDAGVITGTIDTQLTLTAFWSLRQDETFTVPVTAFFVQGRVFLPLVSRQECCYTVYTAGHEELNTANRVMERYFHPPADALKSSTAD